MVETKKKGEARSSPDANILTTAVINAQNYAELGMESEAGVFEEQTKKAEKALKDAGQDPTEVLEVQLRLLQKAIEKRKKK